MPVQLTLCRLCSRSRPEFCRALAQLLADHPGKLVVEELECMAACDDVPAIMLETDYHPRLRPAELIQLVELHLTPLQGAPISRSAITADESTPGSPAPG